MRLEIVDVFAEQKFAGNQLAVVRDAGELDSQTMQDIAREMNFSETTFVISEDAQRARVRIFTPEWELPFAGHPTVGTAWVLAGGAGEYTLDLDVGPVAVSFEDGIGWMTPPDVSLGGSLAEASALIGLSDEHLHCEFPVRLAEVGPKFVLIGVRDLATLKQSKLNTDLHRQLLAQGQPVQCVFVFTDEPYGPDADFASRMFFESGGVREDPATGSANTAFAAYLRDLRGPGFDCVVDQGVEIKRPSRLYLQVRESIRVGGKTFSSVSGNISA